MRNDAWREPGGRWIHRQFAELLDKGRLHRTVALRLRLVDAEVERALGAGRIVVHADLDGIAGRARILRGDHEHRGIVLGVKRALRDHRAAVERAFGIAHDPGLPAAVEEELPDLVGKLAHVDVPAEDPVELPVAEHRRRHVDRTRRSHPDKGRDRGRDFRDRMDARGRFLDVDTRIGHLNGHGSLLLLGLWSVGR